MINEETDNFNQYPAVNTNTDNNNLKIDEQIAKLVTNAMTPIFQINHNKYPKLTTLLNKYLTIITNYQKTIMEGFQKMKNDYQKNSTIPEKTIHILGKDILIEQVMTIKQFIEKECQAPIQAQITKEFPKATTIDKDYKIVVNDLHSDNILQDEQLLIKVIPLKEKKIDKELLFSATIEYDYDNDQQIKAIDGILNMAIPQQFMAGAASKKFNFLTKENASTEFPKYAKMIRNVIPLRLLLDEPYLPIKIVPELLSACRLNTDFYSEWSGVWSDYNSGSGGLTIIPNKKNGIRTIKNLYDLNNSYFNKIFYLIQAKLLASGVDKCTVKKAKIIDKNGKEFCHAVGNVNFIKNFEITNEGWEADIYYDRSFFIQVNLEVTFKNKSKLYPGVVLLLTDQLTMYNSNSNFEWQNTINQVRTTY